MLLKDQEPRPPGKFFDLKILSCPNRRALPSYSIGVYVNAGSRQDTLETTGAANMLRMMLTRGTAGQSKAGLAEEIESMGARISSDTGREISSFNINCFKGDTSRAVAMLGDAFSNATLDAAELEIAKQEQGQANEAFNKDFEGTMYEAIHFNAFRDHMLGQPMRGDPDNLQNLTSDVLSQYRSANFIGDKMVIVGTGAVEHDDFVGQVKEAFSGIQKEATIEEPNTDKCVYVPALLMMRDDEMYNANVGVFYDAPSVNHEDYYSFQLLRHMIGDYDIQKNAEHLNDCQKQYNATQGVLAELPDVTKQQCKYFAYSDCGIWGSYLFGNEIFVRQMNWVGTAAPTFYSDYVTEVEVVRARNAYWNDLMKEKNNCEMNTEIGTQMLQTGRRITRSEIAKRISYADAEFIKGLSYQWFYDAEPSFTNWGPIQDTSSMGSYKYYKLNCMTTVSNMHHSLFT